MKLQSYEAIKQAYSDCNGFKGERSLDFKASESMSGDDLIKFMPEITPDGYNEFDPVNSINALVKFFGNKAEYFVAREGSVCIYVNALDRVWISARKPERLESLAEEVSLEPGGMFRLWWD